MGLGETIIAIKTISKKLRDRNISEQETIIFNEELHALIDKLEVPEIVNLQELTGVKNDYIS